MKIGIRTPNLNKRIKARTTSKIKRQLKASINPLYGKNGVGYINDPKKAVYNKIYNKTTMSVDDLILNKEGNKSNYINKKSTPINYNYEFNQADLDEARIELYKYKKEIIKWIVCIVIFYLINKLIPFMFIFCILGGIFLLVSIGCYNKQKKNVRNLEKEKIMSNNE